MTDLPPGWEWATLEDLANPMERAITDGPFGSNLKSEHYTKIGARVIRLQNIGDGHFRDERSYISMERFETLRTHEVREGDLVVASLGDTPPRACLVPTLGGPAIVKADCIRIRLSSHVDSRWVLHTLISPQTKNFAANLIKGVGRPRLGLAHIRALRVPVPPLAEQRRIVAILEEQLSCLAASSTLIDESQLRKQQLESVLLEHAVTGRLSNTLATDSSASGLVMKSQNWISDRCQRRVSSSARRLPEAASNELGRSTLPTSWKWCEWGHLGLTQNGAPFPSSNYQKSGVRLIRPGNLDASGFVNWVPSITKCLPESYAHKHPSLMVPAGSLIVNLTAQSLKDNFLGRACMKLDSEPALLNQRLAWLKPAFMNTRYLWLVFRSPLFRRFVDRLNTGSLIQHIHAWQIEKFMVPVPPLSEQVRIVARYEELSSRIKKGSEHTFTSTHRIEVLRNSIFRAAFSGKLLSQDPNDEPASVLLERIKAGRAAQPKARRGRRTQRQPDDQGSLL
jgi:restriction endonuclease S subunit